MRAKNRKFMRKQSKNVDSNLKGMFGTSDVSIQDIRRDFQEPASLPYLVSGDAVFRSEEAGTYPNELWRLNSRLHATAGLAREASMYKHPNFIEEARKALDIVNSRDDFSKKDVEFFNRFMNVEIAKAEKLAELRAKAPVEQKAPVRIRPQKKRVNHVVEGHSCQHDAGMGLWDNFKSLARDEYNRLRRSYNMLHDAITNEGDILGEMRRLAVHYNLFDNAVRSAPANLTAAQGLNAREIVSGKQRNNGIDLTKVEGFDKIKLKKQTYIAQPGPKVEPKVVKKSSVLDSVKALLSWGQIKAKQKEEKQKRLDSLEVIKRNMPKVYEERQRERREAAEKAYSLNAVLNLRAPGHTYKILAKRDANEFRDARESIKAGLGVEYTVQNLIDELTPTEVAEFAKKKYYGTERLENLISLVAKKRLKEDAKQELQEAKENLKSQLVEEKAKAAEEKAYKKYENYKRFASNGKELTFDEFKEVCSSVKYEKGNMVMDQEENSDGEHDTVQLTEKVTTTLADGTVLEARLDEDTAENLYEKALERGKSVKEASQYVKAFATKQLLQKVEDHYASKKVVPAAKEQPVEVVADGEWHSLGNGASIVPEDETPVAEQAQEAIPDEIMQRARDYICKVDIAYKRKEHRNALEYIGSLDHDVRGRLVSEMHKIAGTDDEKREFLAQHYARNVLMQEQLV